jgi:hypothetical protein
MANANERTTPNNSPAAEGGSTAAPAPASAATAKADRPPATVRYVDRPDLTEIFSDSISGMMFDGQVLRIEFAVTRLDDVKPNAPISGRRYPACRVVLSASGALDLINRVQQIAAALRQSAAAKQPPQPSAT